jgi:hypothetical protein
MTFSISSRLSWLDCISGWYPGWYGKCHVLISKIVRFLQTISNDPDLGRVAYNHEYTQIYIKISPFKSLIYINYFYIFTEILILKNNDRGANKSLIIHKTSQNNIIWSCIWVYLGKKSRRTEYIYNHEYTQIYIKISPFKSLIYINYFYIFTEILILKTILVFLKLMQLI